MELAIWLVERAVEHDSPATLLVLVTEHLRATRSLARELARRARRLVEQRYDWRSIGDALDRAVNELVARQRGPRAS